MDIFKLIYSFFGGLGIFFYGMKSLSDGLQAVAGELIQKIINSLTTNRFLAVLVGMGVTSIVQSSSVTTVMVVGMVNAGLMKLTQAIGVIFGANIGTTITGWIISLNISKFGLMFVGLGIFPTLFAPKEAIKQIGKAIFGIGLVFIGLDTMSESFIPLRESEDFLKILQYFNKEGFSNTLMNVSIGCLLTMIVQSSSAMLGITMALAHAQLIQTPAALALVLGENVGTTITAILASIGGNIHAKRAARAHSIFNIVGVIIVLSIFPYYVNFITGMELGVEKHIALGHSIFNITCTLIFLPFIKQYARLIEFLFKDPIEKERVSLKFMGPNSSDMVGATGIYQAKEELKKLKEINSKMFTLFLNMITKEIQNPNNNELLAKAKHYEEITDRIQKEITVFTCQIMQQSLSAKQSHQCQILVQVADDLETIADYLERIIVLYIKVSPHLFKDPTSSSKLQEKVHLFIQKIWNYYVLSSYSIDQDQNIEIDGPDRKEMKENTQLFNLNTYSVEIINESEVLRELYLDEVTKGVYTPESMLIFSDFIMALKNLRGHCLSMANCLKYW